MKPVKIILLLVLTVTIFSACGGKNEETNATNQNTKQTAQPGQIESVSKMEEEKNDDRSNIQKLHDYFVNADKRTMFFKTKDFAKMILMVDELYKNDIINPYVKNETTFGYTNASLDVREDKEDIINKNNNFMS